MRIYLNQIPENEWTLWERIYHKKRPYHFYKIRSEWDATDRDFMAYWNGRLQDALGEYGHPSARPVRAIDVWLDPIIRDGVSTRHATREQWREFDVASLEAFEQLSWHEMDALRGCGVPYHETYANAVATRWDSLTQDERDEVRGMTDDDKAARHEFETMTPEERADMRLESLKQEAAHLGKRAGSYFAANIARPGRGENWLRVMIALGCVFDGSHGKIRQGRAWDPVNDEIVSWADPRWERPHHDTLKRAIALKPYTAKEARESAKIWSGWNPFADILDRLEKRGMIGAVPDDVVAAYDEDMGSEGQAETPRDPVNGHTGPEGPPGKAGNCVVTCEVPNEMAEALKAGNWAEVARLAQERALGG